MSSPTLLVPSAEEHVARARRALDLPALLDAPGSSDAVVAQFDHPGLSCDGRALVEVDPLSVGACLGPRTRLADAGDAGAVVDLSLGWHEFPAGEFTS